MSTFWTIAQRFMDDKGLKQVDLARHCDRPKGTIFNWIKRDTLPPADSAVKIAELLGVTVRYLVTGQRQEGELEPREKELLRVCSILRDDKFDAVMKVARIMHDTTMQELSAASSSGASGRESV